MRATARIALAPGAFSVMTERELRALIVDVSAAAIDPVVRALGSRWRMRWRRVDTEESFVAALETGDWDIVLAELHTRRLAPPRAIAILRERGRDIPVIAVAATAGAEEVAATLEAGARDFLYKTTLARLPFVLERELTHAGLRRRHLEAEREIGDHRRHLQELEEAVEARDRFLSIASHELRTPLTPLTLQIDRLSRALARNDDLRRSRERLQEMIQMMRRQCDRLIELVKNLLDVSRITSGKLTLNREQVDLAAVVRQVRDDFVEAIHTARASVELHAPDDLVGSWDAERIKSVVENLLSNALKYGQGKPVAIRVSNHGNTAHLVVTDHGIGISELDQQRIFERFERAVATNRYGGLGIGLWIVREVVEAHGGTVAVSSAPGSGTTFVVTLPKSAPTTARTDAPRR